MAQSSVCRAFNKLRKLKVGIRLPAPAIPSDLATSCTTIINVLNIRICHWPSGLIEKIRQWFPWWGWKSNHEDILELGEKIVKMNFIKTVIYNGVYSMEKHRQILWFSHRLNVIRFFQTFYHIKSVWWSQIPWTWLFDKAARDTDAELFVDGKFSSLFT